jgi:hypothetical protein
MHDGIGAFIFTHWHTFHLWLEDIGCPHTRFVVIDIIS